ncbi:acyltransferase family protein [Nocardioides sp. SYSU DS0663]|uniref:acyltransferase family protein n=1 Tax=Nocardioides sp. SYSU DS0663 TaxID=3416445 RepID=UPI003F4BB6C8
MDRSGPTNAGRFDYLDGLRAVAISAVLALHWLAWYVPFFHGGAIGVDVFFVLSGFIITTMLWRTRGTGRVLTAYGSFLKRRVVRLYPALVGLVVVSALLFWLVPASGLAPGEVGRRGLLVLAQTTSVWGAMQEGSFLVPALAPFGVTWSLAVEWYFYLLWPLLLLAAARRGWTARRTAHVTTGVGAGCYLLSLGLSPFWFYFGPTARFAELLAGCALALYLQSRPADAAPLRVPAAAPALALTALALYVVLGPESHGPYRWAGVPLAVSATLVLICAGYSAHGGPVRALLSHPVLTYVGRLSYSLYLWHTVPFLLLADVPGLPMPVLGMLALSSVAVLTLGSYYLLERPFLRPRGDVLSPGAGKPGGSGRARTSPRSRIRILRSRPVRT